MSKNNSYQLLKHVVCLCLLVMTGSPLIMNAQDSLIPEPSDTTAVAGVKKTKEKGPTFTYVRVGIDLSKVVSSALQKQYDVLEFQADVYYKKDLYFAAEFGTGNSLVENNYLKYKSHNTFISLGLDKTFFGKDFRGDFDNAFVGLRYGLGLINRGEAGYAIHDTVWGNTQGLIPAEHFIAHWLELTGGFRMELIKNIFVGWNVRARTFINPKKFEKLPPSYVAGYGRGDKNSNFGYNFYVLYGLGKRR